jgi:DNA polymerase III subunit delta'
MSWARIRGHDGPRHLLATAHSQGRLAHAYLMVGPDGIGKRTFAYELCKTLLCQAPPHPFTPCDRCQACQQVEAGSHPDVNIARLPEDKQELPVKLMREEFIPRLGLKASRGGWKIGFVEDADAFNEEAANCFLKTLEEPPAKTLLLLRSRTLERQLPTIRSRCQVLRFAPLNDANMTLVLADHEITDTERLSKLLPLADGSPGLALSLDDDQLWDTRTAMVSNLTSNKPDSPQLIQDWVKYVDGAGKDNRLKRQRCSLVLRLLIAALRSKLHESAPDQNVEGWMQRIEVCIEADGYVERRVGLETMIEAISDKLCKS